MLQKEARLYKKIDNGITSIPYNGRDLLPCLIVFVTLDIMLIFELGILICFFIAGHILLLYTFFQIKSKFRITINKHKIIWQTLFTKHEFLLKEAAYIGITRDFFQSYMSTNLIYENDRLIHLLFRGSIFTFNPKCFYEENTFFKMHGSDVEQLEWKAKDDAVISHIKNKCVLVIEETKKRRILNKINFWDFFKNFFYLMLAQLPYILIVFII